METTFGLTSRFFPLLLLTAPIFGQGFSLEGPIGGFVFDAPSRSIRPLVGLLGAARLGSPVLTGVAFASVAPDQRKAITLSEAGLQLIADLRNPAASAQSLPGAIPSASQALWADGSSAAVLFSASEKQLQFVWQDGGAIFLGTPCDLSSLPAPVRLLAALPAARIAAVVTSAEEKSAVYLVREGAPPVLAGLFAAPVAAAFAPTGGALYLAAASSLYRISSFQVHPEMEVLIENAAALDNAIAIAVTNNGPILFIASAASRRIRAYDLNLQRFLDDLELDSLPSRFESFGATSFVLNPLRAARDPVLILETVPAPRVIFIPSGE